MMRRLMIMLLRGYKQAISPLFPPACRYVPTCSEYAMEAVELRGPILGLLMALWRLLRCHPFSRGGYDPVARGCDSALQRESSLITDFDQPCAG